MKEEGFLIPIVGRARKTPVDGDKASGKKPAARDMPNKDQEPSKVRQPQFTQTSGVVESMEATEIMKTIWKKRKDPHPQDKIQHLDFTKDLRPLYYKTPPCAFYHKNVCSKAVFGP